MFRKVEEVEYNARLPESLQPRVTIYYFLFIPIYKVIRTEKKFVHPLKATEKLKVQNG